MRTMLTEFPLSIKIIIVTGAGAAGYLAAAFIPWRRAGRAILADLRAWQAARAAARAADRVWLEQLEGWIGSRQGGGGLFVDAPGSGPAAELAAAAGLPEDDLDAALAPNGYWRARDRARRGLER
jgi:threonine dehydrogenase-like Zn-dependent dehydrogenase